MIRKILIGTVIGLSVPAIANAVDLQVVFEGDCPVEVIDHSDSCGNGQTSNYACADNGAAVRWAPASCGWSQQRSRPPRRSSGSSSSTSTTASRARPSR